MVTFIRFVARSLWSTIALVVIGVAIRHRHRGVGLRPAHQRRHRLVFHHLVDPSLCDPAVRDPQPGRSRRGRARLRTRRPGSSCLAREGSLDDPRGRHRAGVHRRGAAARGLVRRASRLLIILTPGRAKPVSKHAEPGWRPPSRRRFAAPQDEVGRRISAHLPHAEEGEARLEARTRGIYCALPCSSGVIRRMVARRFWRSAVWVFTLRYCSP